jgi:hypothetical protein
MPCLNERIPKAAVFGEFGLVGSIKDIYLRCNRERVKESLPPRIYMIKMWQ